VQVFPIKSEAKEQKEANEAKDPQLPFIHWRSLASFKRGGQPFTVCYHTNPMTFVYILLAAVLCVSGYIAWKLTASSSTEDADPRLKAELDRRMEEIGELKQKLIEVKSEKDEISGKGKAMYENFKNLQSDLKVLQNERDTLTNRISKFESQSDAQQKRNDEMAARLEGAQKALEEEKMRIRREDEERQELELEEFNRKWNEHEQNVIALMSGLVKKEDSKFTAFSNTNLPEGFSGSLKPDFMIAFLDQYVIFDAKVSRSQDLHTYIKDAVKKTATKVKGNEKIYRSIFLVVPTDAISTLKQLSYYEEGFHFYVISPEAVEPILASLKRIEHYEFAEAMDPQERENIVDIIAALHFHISTRNAHELHMMLHGLDILAKAEKVNPELLAEAMIKKAKMRNINLNTAETKEMVSNPKVVAAQLLELMEPRAKISKKDLKMFDETE